MADFVAGGNILFVCQAGIVRSPMAAAVFDAKMQARKFNCRVGYACLMPFMTDVPPVRQWSMIETARDYDLSRNRSRYLGEAAMHSTETFFVGMDARIADLVRAVTQADEERVFILNPPDGVLDPGGSMTLDAYKDSFTQIYAGVDKLIEKLGLNRPQ